jgi:hypothetical protein
MNRPDEPLSTRDLASSPAEQRGEPEEQDSREDPETVARHDDATSPVERTPASSPTGDTDLPREEGRANITEPGAESSAGVAEEPGAESSAKVAEPAEPAAESSARVAEPAEPAAESSARVAEPAEPASDGDQAPLLAEHERAELGSSWESIQANFVDDPRRAVEEADGLVANVMQQLADGFARERETLEGQWSRGEDVSTEDLRVALRRYRSFFQRLLSA